MATLAPHILEIQRCLDSGALRFTRGVEFTPGHITAQAQQGSKHAYAVSLHVSQWPTQVRGRVVSRIAADAQVRSQVENGQISQTLLTLLRAEGADLHVTRPAEVKSSCSCASRNDFCLHALALIVILEGAMADKPHLMLAVRGLPLDLLQLALSQCPAPSAELQQRSPAGVHPVAADATELRAPEALPLPPPPCTTVFSGATRIAALGHLDGWKMVQQPEALWRPSILLAAQAALARAARRPDADGARHLG